jgi:hypothetical protein
VSGGRLSDPARAAFAYDDDFLRLRGPAVTFQAPPTDRTFQAAVLGAVLGILIDLVQRYRRQRQRVPATVVPS